MNIQNTDWNKIEARTEALRSDVTDEQIGLSILSWYEAALQTTHSQEHLDKLNTTYHQVAQHVREIRGEDGVFEVTDAMWPLYPTTW